MYRVSSTAVRAATQTARRDLRDSEASFGTIFADIATLLYPPPKTAAHVAVLIGCTERNVEACLSGKQKWSGDAIAAITAEILRRHAMRNVKVIPK